MELSADIGYKIELFLNAIALKDMDVFTKSDPFVKVYFGKNGNQWAYIGRTETINNDLNPTWSKTFVLNYVFESNQDIKFEVCDDDGNNKDELIGTVQTTLGVLAGARFQTALLPIVNGNQGRGKLVVKCEKFEESLEFVTMKWKAAKLMNTDSVFDWWNKSDPYLKFLKVRQDGSVVLASQTQVIANTLNPSWNPIEIQTTRLSAAKQQKFKIQCWDRQPQGKSHQFIGQIFLSPLQLQPNKQYKLSNPKHNKPGSLQLQYFNVITKPRPPTFIDYLRSGLQLNLIVAIDFTGSNGSPTANTSLHYINPNSSNHYQTALKQIGDILLNYDSDKSIPCFGFGAKPKYPDFKQTIANHCFPLSGNMNMVNATSMKHLETLYQTAVSNVQFAGPTYFHPLMTEAFQVAEQCKKSGSDTYQVLLILTDGQIHDMDKTVDLICANTTLPISIIIVGIGNADFGNMRRLDGDNGLINSYGVRAPRDIVQFVPYRDVNNNPTKLSTQLLAQLPNQVVQYMNLVGRKPGPPLNLDLKKLLQSATNKGTNVLQQISVTFAQSNTLKKYVQQQNPMVQKLAKGANQTMKK